MNENPNNEATSAARPDPLKDAIADSVNREKTRTAKGLLKEISSAETDTEAAGTLSRLDKALDELPPEMISSLEGTFIDVMNISEREIGKAREAYEFSLREVVNETLLAREGRNLFEMSKDERAAYFAAIVDEQEIARRNRDTIKRGAAAVLNPELVSRQAVSANLYAGTLDTLWKVVNALTAFCNSKIWDLYDRLFPDMRYYFKGIQPQQESILDAFALLEFCVELDAAAPFAEEETNAFKEKTGAEFITFRDFTEKVLPACLDRAHKAIFKTDESDVEALTKELAELSSVETLKSILPARHISPISKVANVLPEKLLPGITEKGLDLDVSGRGKMYTRALIVLDEDKDNAIFSGRPYTEYDRSVMDAVISLWEYGDKGHTFTADMVYRAMNNMKQTEKVSPQAKSAITKSIEKMRHIFIKIDATDEFTKREITNVSATLDGYLLSVTGVEVSAGGKKVKAYSMTAPPVLYVYSKAVGQIMDVNAELLDVKKVTAAGNISTVSIKKSENLTVIRDYLLRRIQEMKRDRENKKPHLSNRIKFEDLYQKTGTNAAVKQYAAAARNMAFQILDFFKVKKVNGRPFIKDYKIVKEGNAIKGVDITLD